MRFAICDTGYALNAGSIPHFESIWRSIAAVLLNPAPLEIPMRYRAARWLQPLLLAAVTVLFSPV